VAERSHDFIQQARTSNSRFLDGAPVRRGVPAIHAPAGQVDTHVAPLQIGNPAAGREAIPPNHAPRSGPGTAAEYGYRVSSCMEIAGQDMTHLSAAAGYDNLHTLFIRMMADTAATPRIRLFS